MRVAAVVVGPCPNYSPIHRKIERLRAPLRVTPQVRHDRRAQPPPESPRINFVQL
jgi:hypothetical protein